MTPVRIVLAAVLALIGVGCTTHVPPKVCRATQYVDVTFQRFVRLHGDRHAEFCVTNALAQPVWFAGYSLQSPLFKIQLLKDGRWQDSPMGWCGAGLGLRELPSKASTTFTVPVPPPSPGIPSGYTAGALARACLRSPLRRRNEDLWRLSKHGLASTDK